MTCVSPQLSTVLARRPPRGSTALKWEVTPEHLLVTTVLRGQLFMQLHGGEQRLEGLTKSLGLTAPLFSGVCVRSFHPVSLAHWSPSRLHTHPSTGHRAFALTAGCAARLIPFKQVLSEASLTHGAMHSCCCWAVSPPLTELSGELGSPPGRSDSAHHSQSLLYRVQVYRR